MDTFAYCTAPAAPAVKQAMGGGIVLTSPPYTARGFPAGELQKRDFLYFRLHQVEGMPLVWMGEGDEDGMLPALRVEQVRGLDMRGAVVMIANCYSDRSPFVPAFYDNGAGAVIAAPGPNFAAGERVIGADLLAKWLVRGLRLGLGVRRALAMAKSRVAITAYRRADRDALAFRIIGDKRDERT